jgi:hypothetical protein
MYENGGIKLDQKSMRAKILLSIIMFQHREELHTGVYSINENRYFSSKVYSITKRYTYR